MKHFPLCNFGTVIAVKDNKACVIKLADMI